MAREDGAGDVERPAPAAGEPAAQRFAEWASPSLLAMTRLAHRLAPAGGAEDIDDVVQDALVRAWQKWHLYDETRGSATTWLLAITADRARAARLRRVRSLRAVDDAAELPEHEPASGDLDSDLDLERAIGRLSERQRLAVHLHYFLDLSIDDTAAVMDCSPGTVKSTLHDARRKLRQELGTGDEH